MSTQTPNYHRSNEAECTQAIQESYNTMQIIKIKNIITSNMSVTQNFLKPKPNIFIFGAGGTTSWFLPKLLKLFNDAFYKNPGAAYPLEIVLIDKDEVEAKNIIRQNFISEDIGYNKAQVLSERYSELYDNIKVSYVNKYATCSYYDNLFLPDNEYPEEHFVDINELGIRNKDIMINLVDNEGFKKKLDVFSSRKKILTFNAGVNLYNGQVYYSLYDGISNGYVADHPDLEEIFDEVSVHACADADADGTDDNPEQMFNGNDIAATMLANLFQCVMNDIPLYKKITFNTGTGISASSDLKSYSYFLSLLRKVLCSDSYISELSKASNYAARYGQDKTTPAAVKYYKVLQEYEMLKDIFKCLK